VGISNDPNTRWNAHKRTKGYTDNTHSFSVILTNLTRNQALGWEQALITAFTLDALDNIINSISKLKLNDAKYELSRVGELISSFWDGE